MITSVKLIIFVIFAVEPAPYKMNVQLPGSAQPVYPPQPGWSAQPGYPPQSGHAPPHVPQTVQQVQQSSTVINVGAPVSS